MHLLDETFILVFGGCSNGPSQTEGNRNRNMLVLKDLLLYNIVENEWNEILPEVDNCPWPDAR